MRVALFVKGRGHLKMEILSLFAHPHVVSNPYAVMFFFPLWNRRTTFEEVLHNSFLYKDTVKLQNTQTNSIKKSE